MEDDYNGASSESGEPNINGSNKQRSYLYYLSTLPAFKYLKKVVLVSSPKDQYVPFYSARVQVII